ncbi:ubiquitin specific protease 10 isoform X2 [Arctopsyche grandis]|uniref:ubiquitin specific protease 10 isoform X2 n=1 Tax=Arctopsyche grandis TaxID=121162 RepID=UPI00406D684D
MDCTSKSATASDCSDRDDAANATATALAPATKSPAIATSAPAPTPAPAPAPATSEYGFLDLTDIDEEERSSLTSALFASAPAHAPAASENWSSGDKTDSQVTWTDPNYDLSSCSSGTPGPPTTSSSLDSLTTTEREMAPHSPQRSAPAPAASNQPVPHQPPLAYTQPPPPLYNPGPPANHHWTTPHLLPPSVYVSQVTANVNVHGYMGQYYQPQYVPHVPQEPRGRDGRDRGKGRRGGGIKRVQSPPQPYIYYPHYYQPPQTAQGAPLYHVPVYPSMGYVAAGYPYMPYMDYGIMEDPNQIEKGPEEYPPEMMIEQEHVPHEMFYSQHPACLPPSAVYDPNRPLDGACSLEGYPTFYAMPPPPAPQAHQYNVHAKSFVRQSDHKSYINPQPESIKVQDNHNAVDTLPMKDLKIAHKQGVSVKQLDSKNIAPTQNTSQPLIKNPPQIGSDKVVPKPATETVKTAWNANKPDVAKTILPVTVSAQVVTTTPTTTATVTKSSVPVPANTLVPSAKVTKTNVPPFTNKTFVKTGPPQQLAGVIMPQQGLPSKAPFANKHKKETAELSTEPASATTPAPEPKLVKPAPVAITVHNQTTAPITNKAPFSHARKPSVSSVETVTTPITPTPPKASDFPPPPAPRRSVVDSNQSAPAPVPVVTTPSSSRTWASLFVQPAAPASPQTDDSASVQTAGAAKASATINPASVLKPVAKVGPFDASLSQDNSNDKSGEKASTNQKPLKKDGSESADSSQNSMPAHINDPLAYARGEFLSVYQLNHHTVSLQPRGLCNRSNYCYINAILQALIACPPFYNMLKSLPSTYSKRGKSSTPIIDAMVELCGEFVPLPPGARITRPERAARNGPTAAAGDSSDNAATPVSPPVNVGAPFEPSTVLHMLRDMNNGDSFRIEGRQEDAEEFLGCLLNALNDEMLELIKLYEPDDSKDSPVAVNGNDTCQDSDDDEEWKVMGPKNKGSIERRCLAGRTPLSDIFRGQLRSRLQRATDTAMSDTTHCVQPFFTLPLDIERSNSVREALERVALKDKLEGVTCPSRGRPVEAWQQVLLDRLPVVLLLHLKCFHCRPEDGATVKIVKSIDYPVDLKIDPKIISPKMKYGIKQRSYKLFAVVYHEGSEAEKGHYLTDAYHVGCGGWLRYDDSIVSSVTEQQVLHPRSPRTPYLLLYRRQDTMQIPRHPQP